ncbi:DUF397 domain-containing protein [Actinomadura parmotrematis]|uniref:DUF397 domain-containing protein n=1 Tax=Actinomadura parmotrematis TaxID=2864039 RepID=A0ABS7G497_9ACTN|nr:DUF397 domain-containing protein [Actinomadura parmotrematis]MBW8487301.1 DUF397 domain-containing protein [Actinomadura parmotrematis]
MDVKWRKSSRSSGAGDAACIELAALPRQVAVRDSKDPGGPKLLLDRAGLLTLLETARRA